MSNIEIIKSVRYKTGLSLKEISKTVELLNTSDEDTIIKHLREQGVLKAQARQDRETTNGGIFSYVHDSRLGVMVEIKCETDFVARGDLFKLLGQDLCLHLAAYQPRFLSEKELDQDFIKSEVEVAREQLINERKNQEMIDKILVGKTNKIIKENAFLSQPFLKNPEISVQDYIHQTSQSTGEKIEISRFVIYTLNS